MMYVILYICISHVIQDIFYKFPNIKLHPVTFSDEKKILCVFAVVPFKLLTLKFY